MASRDPAGFVAVHGEHVPWRPHPSVSGGEFAILLGHWQDAGPLVMRVKLPPHVAVMPHRHPEARTYTVLAGDWMLGFGEEYEAAVLIGYPAGSLYRLPAGVPHFQASGSSGAIVQIESIGPTRDEFIAASDIQTRVLNG